MTSENVITVKGKIVQWLVKDARGTSGSTGDLAWHSSVSGTANFTGDSNTFWNVSKIQLIPATGQSSDSFAAIHDNSATSGNILVRHNFGAVREMDNVQWDFDPPLRCQPYLGSSTHMGTLTTGAYWLFTLA